MATIEKDQYVEAAEQYTKIDALPLSRLEHELIPKAIGNCSGAKVLDLGGGAGVHARAAIAAGAQVVDLIDISEAMMEMGKKAEEDEGRHGKIRFILGDVIKPLDLLGLEKASYDVVMANWIFDHATNVTELEAMWQNIATYIKPGGRFLGVRVGNVHSSAAAHGKYGEIFHNIKQIPGGWSFTLECKIDPPMFLDATSMDISTSGSLEMHEKYGFSNIKVDIGRDSKVVAEDPEFWEEFLRDPSMVVVTAVKT